MMRLVLTALLSLWLVTGCTTAGPAASAPTLNYYSYCPVVIFEIGQFTKGASGLTDVDDEASLAEMRLAATKLADVRFIADRQLPPRGRGNGQWLRAVSDTAAEFYWATENHGTGEFQEDVLRRFYGAMDNALATCVGNAA